MFGSGGKSADPGRAAARPKRSAAPPLLARTGRFTLILFAITAAFGAVGVRLWWLHVTDAAYLRRDAEAARRFTRISNAQRGKILDARGGILAVSREVWDVGVDPNQFTTAEQARLAEIAADVSKLIHVPARQLHEAFERRFREVKSAEDTEGRDKDAEKGGDESAAAPGEIEPEVSKDLAVEGKMRRIHWIKLAEGVDLETRNAIQSLRVKAVYSVRRFEREYPQGSFASHLIGYMNKAGTPAMGVEKAFDFYLKGEDGWIDSRKNRNQQEMVDRRIREVPPADGQDVELTIDPFIQQFVEEELNRIDSEFTPLSASIIVSEAKTGKILALGNRPTFNLNDYFNKEKAPMESQRNRAVTDIYEPGSVFKIVSYSAGIQEGMFTPDSMIDCNLGSVPFKGRMMDLPEDSHPVGRVDLRHAVWKSSNRGAAQVGMKVAELRGEARLWQYITGFGFGSNSGLVTGTEVPGLLPKPEKWGVSVTRIPMGHSVSVTAMQMHFGMSVLASKGDLFAPMLVSRILSREKPSPDRQPVVVREFEPTVRKKNVITRSTAETVTDMLRGVVSKDGTAKDAIIPGYDVAGKTGTTQKIIDGKYSKAHHVASFSGFFPASDPRVVITVIMDDPHGKGIAYGGTYSAPAFKNIAEKIIRRLEIAPVNQAEFNAARDKDRKKSGLPPITPVPASGAYDFAPFLPR